MIENPMRFLSVCSGIEAASVAWAPLGWHAAAFSEIDAFPSAVLAHRFPTVPNLGDMTRFQEWPDLGTVDLVCGGTPCQAFSVAGLRKGLADPRGNLALAFLAIVDRYRPRWVVWENVPGVLSSNGGRDFGSFVGGLGKLGYGWAYRVLDAQWCRVDGFPRAVPQRRRRVFVVGHLGEWRRAAAVLFEPESVLGDTPPRREAGEGSAADTAPCLTSSGRGVELTGETRGQDRVVAVAFGGGNTSGSIDAAACLTAKGQRIDFEVETFVAHSLRAEGFDASEDGTGRGTPLVPVHAFDARQGDVIQYGNFTGPLDTDGHTMAVVFDAAQITSKTNRSTLQPVSPTMARQSSPHAVYAHAVRRLTPRECERLQGLPDDWTLIPYRGKPAADGPRYKAIGNSWAVNVARWIGRRIEMVEQIARGVSP